MGLARKCNRRYVHFARFWGERIEKQGGIVPSVRQATVRLLRDLGITTIFGNPGSTELPLFREFPDDFRYILGLQESVVIGIADGFAQATRNAAFVNLHSSAGTGHALGNIFTAFKNQTPLVVTAGQQARSILPYDPFLYAERPTEFPRPFIKWACEPARATDVPLALARAYYEVMTPPQGPVFVSIPVDDWDQPCDWVQARQIATLNPGDPTAISRLAAAIEQATSPAFVLGAGTARDQAWEAMVSLAEHQKASVYAGTYASRNVFPESHPLFRGFLPAFREKLVDVLAPHDLIVSFGGPLNLYHAEGVGPHVPRDSQCWSVGDNPGVLAWAPQGGAILGNTRAVATQLDAMLPRSRRREPASRARPTVPRRDTLTDQLALHRIAANLPAGAIIVEEAPTSRAAMQDQLRLDQPDTFYTTASGGLGFGMPAAVGIALGRPGTKIVAIMGDGSAMYAIQALFSAYQLSLPITFLIINNARYKALQTFGHTFGMDAVVGTGLTGLDFVSLAKGHGLPDATRVTSADALDAALAAAFRQDGPTLVEVIVQ